MAEGYLNTIEKIRLAKIEKNDLGVFYPTKGFIE